jgi:tripeptide aminopeptidase
MAPRIDPDRLLQRFLRYVAVDTTADESALTYPSSPGQMVLGLLLVEELRELGLTDITQTPHGIVSATVPSTIAGRRPVVAFNSHLDTSPETSGAGVKPQVLRNYRGGDIVLPGNPSKVIRVSESPELSDLVGATLVTTDGTTLLGGDDKAGLAIIMELAHTLTHHTEIPHGPVRILFTCDEEIGHGVDHVDMKALAADVAYTLDGPGAGTIDTETFSADLATVRLTGVNIHPAIAKDRMVNSIRAAGEFVARLPRETLTPERSAGRDGFLHPYRIEGGVAESTLRIILRDFNTAALTGYRELLEKTASEVTSLFPGLKASVEITPQYRNLGDGLAREPRAVEYAHEASRRLGRTLVEASIRGGTDGSQLTERGLPTPNLSSGQHNPHSPLEWVCLDEMTQAVEMLVELVQVWGEDPARR